MAMVELDEAEYLNLKKISDSVGKMLANPKTRSKILEAQKEINPDAVIPELDATKPVYEKIDAVSAQVGELAKKLADKETADKEQRERDALTARWNESRQAAVRAGYTAEGLESLEKYMVEKGIADHEVAMPAFERIQPRDTVIADTQPGRFSAFTDLVPADDKDDVNLLLNGSEQHFLTKRINETLNQVRGR